MYTKQEIAAGVRQAITDQAGYTHAEIADENDLELDIRLDALDRVELVMAVEEQFEICISEDESDGVRTVGDMIGLVESKLTEKGQVAA